MAQIYAIALLFEKEIIIFFIFSMLLFNLVLSTQSARKASFFFGRRFFSVEHKIPQELLLPTEIELNNH
jgi:hypothetical protein